MPATETKNTVLKLRQPTGGVEIASDGYTPVTKNMHGAYVDHQSQMILVSEPDADNTHEVLTDTTRLVRHLRKNTTVRIGRSRFERVPHDASLVETTRRVDLVDGRQTPKGQ